MVRSYDVFLPLDSPNLFPPSPLVVNRRATLVRIFSKHGPREGSCSERGFTGEYFRYSREHVEQHPHLRGGQAGLLKVTRRQYPSSQP